MTKFQLDRFEASFTTRPLLPCGDLRRLVAIALGTKFVSPAWSNWRYEWLANYLDKYESKAVELLQNKCKFRKLVSECRTEFVDHVLIGDLTKHHGNPE